MWIRLHYIKLHAKSWLIGKDSDAGRDWGQEEKGTTEDEMAGWHHWLDGRESEWTSGVGDVQGGLACCNSWGRKESDTTERLNCTEDDSRKANCLPAAKLWKQTSFVDFQIKPTEYNGVKDIKPPFQKGDMGRKKGTMSKFGVHVCSFSGVESHTGWPTGLEWGQGVDSSV